MTDVTEVVSKIASNARRLADALDRLPAGIEPPTHEYISRLYDVPQLGWLLFGTGQKDQRERAAAIIRTIGGRWDKQPGDLYSFETTFEGVRLHVTVDRAEVCERVVTGTREITKTVPAPDAPTVEITETVEDVEWVCAPLLAAVSS